MKTTVKTIRVPDDLLEWIEREAEKENRSFSNFLKTLLLKEQKRRDQED